MLSWAGYAAKSMQRHLQPPAAASGPAPSTPRSTPCTLAPYAAVHSCCQQHKSSPADRTVSPLEPDSPVPVSHPICCGELLVWLPLLLLVLHPICCRLLLLLVLHPKHWGQGLLHPGHHLVWHPSGWLLLEWLLLHPNLTRAWHVYCTKTTIVAQMYNTPCIVSHALPRHQCKE